LDSTKYNLVGSTCCEPKAHSYLETNNEFFKIWYERKNCTEVKMITRNLHVYLRRRTGTFETIPTWNWNAKGKVFISRVNVIICYTWKININFLLLTAHIYLWIFMQFFLLIHNNNVNFIKLVAKVYYLTSSDHKLTWWKIFSFDNYVGIYFSLIIKVSLLQPLIHNPLTHKTLQTFFICAFRWPVFSNAHIVYDLMLYNTTLY
jgi:hypothetical protein